MTNGNIEASATTDVQDGLNHYVSLFAMAPVALWEQDFTQVAERLDGLRNRGVVDLRQYLADTPEEVATAVELIKVVNVNSAAVELLEADSKDQLLGGLPRQVLAGDARQSFVEQLVAVWERQPSLDLDFTGMTLSGSQIECLLSWRAPVTDGVIDLSRVIVVVTDLTERERALGAQRESEERFRVLFDTAADAIVAVDHEQHIVLFNEQAVSLFGYEPEEVIGGPLAVLLPASSRPAHVQHVMSFATGSDSRKVMTSRGGMRGLRKNGEEFPIEVTIAKRPMGDRFEFTAVVRDVTERYLARQALEELLRSKDELIASISHELRTPLSAVVGFSQLLRDGESELSAKERAEMVGMIAEQSVDLTNIVEDLLTAAQAESGLLSVASVPVDLRAQVAQVVETYGRRDTEHIEIAGLLVRAVGDPGRIRQILRNLVSNALKYGGDTIVISIGGDSSSATVRVCDNGTGISEEERERVFESYQRARKEPGLTASLGLGLAISRHLAQLMGGDLTYTYEAGESIFELALPVVI